MPSVGPIVSVGTLLVSRDQTAIFLFCGGGKIPAPQERKIAVWPRETITLRRQQMQRVSLNAEIRVP